MNYGPLHDVPQHVCNSLNLNLEFLELFRCSSHAALALLSRGRILGQFASEREEGGSSGYVFSKRFRNIETLLELMLAQRIVSFRKGIAYILGLVVL